jgi:hypothetical protein
MRHFLLQFLGTRNSSDGIAFLEENVCRESLKRAIMRAVY